MAEKQEALPTQRFIEIESVENGTIVLKNGGLRRILLVSGTNFDLKSEEEQGAILGLFQSFLNTLNFSVQIFIHSRKLNIDPYLENLSLRETREPNELLKNQIVEYREFIRAFVAENAIMTKSYFIVVPYDPVKLSETGEAVAKRLFDLIARKGIQAPTERLSIAEKEKQLSEHIEQLDKRVNQVVSSVGQLDVRVVPLDDEELVDLFYNLYNPETIEKKGLAIAEE